MRSVVILFILLFILFLLVLFGCGTPLAHKNKCHAKAPILQDEITTKGNHNEHSRSTTGSSLLGTSAKSAYKPKNACLPESCE